VTVQRHKMLESGVLSFDGSLITYKSQHYGAFSVRLSEIAVLGEFTTGGGPLIDDWFWVFVPRSRRQLVRGVHVCRRRRVIPGAAFHCTWR
jgi:hypothetical protein